MNKSKIKSKKKKKKVMVRSGRAYITATYNNTIITLTDSQGNVLTWSSAGLMGFKGPKKSLLMLQKLSDETPLIKQKTTD